MRLRSLSLLLTCLVILFSCTLNTRAAVSTVNYPNPVRVEVSDYNTGVITNGFYQIKNLATSDILLLKSGLSISFQKTAAGFTASFGAFSLTSSSGFELNEVTGSGTGKYVTFSAKKGAKRNASVTDADVLTYDNGEAAEYVRTYTGSNSQQWYLITAKNGNQLAVLVDQNVQLVSAPAVNTFKVTKISSNNVFRGSLRYVTSSDSAAKPQLINVLSMQDYLKGVVPNEMPASWHLNALKAQAVVARSYAYVKNQRSVLTRTTSSQVYDGYTSETSQSNKAVDETNEEYVKYNNKVIETFFSSTSGGRTASVGDVWNSDQASFPYLTSVEDKYENSPYSNWTRTFSSGQILSFFGYGAGTALNDLTALHTKVGTKSGTTTNNEVSGVTVATSAGTITLSGNENYIRKLFPVEGTYGILPSNWFEIQATKDYKIQRSNGVSEQFSVKGAAVQLASGVTTVTTDSVQINDGQAVFTKLSDPPTINLVGKGFGHRIGLSQYGAKGYAENGWNYKDILTHYYTGTTIGGLN
jgi:stage II sporulation protein D